MTYIEKRGRPRGRPRKDSRNLNSVAVSEPSPPVPSPEVHKRIRSRCICGRNLNYPLKVTDKAIICRCGRRHKKGEAERLKGDIYEM
ncbi:hypothetical protein ES703_53992 [subsurface metagenome]